MRRVLLAGLTVALGACRSAEEPPASAAAVETAAQCADGGALLLNMPSPDWREQVIYMLFIDRFDDGDSDNNDLGHGEYDPARPTHFSGGDIDGVINRIGYLKELGVTAVWVSPPVANQWWSTPYQATGWHGYWATNFIEVDAHFGTLADYQRLSHELHCNGMYLIQDIVGNHVGNFFAYDGPYDPEDTAKHFVLLESDSHQPAPDQPPFHMIDRNNPEHFAADIYHWTPVVQDYADPYQQYYFAFGNLGDLNTENPVVIEALQDSYQYWMETVGVDAFRIDTVSFAPPEFWSEFLHGENGIYPFAKTIGKDFFLTFGEAIYPPEPYDDGAETRTIGYYGSDEQPGINSMLGFPLYYSVSRVVGEGRPTAQLGYRIRKFMERYPDPYLVPTFVDNHDTARFLSIGHGDAFRQALATIFTLPGIPILFQGTEQGLVETRMAMFAGGHRNEQGSFDSTSDYYRYIQRLTSLRRDAPVLVHGNVDVLADDTAGPGLLAYRRTHNDDQAIVLLNTADHTILASNIDTGLAAGQAMTALLAINHDGDVVTDANGQLNLTLAPRAVLVLVPGAARSEAPAVVQLPSLTFDQNYADAVYEQDFVIAGQIDAPNAALKLIINGNLDRATDLAADDAGRWQASVPVRDLGERDNYLEVYSPATGVLSERVTYATRVTEPTLTATVIDSPDDAFGPTGNYVIPQHGDSGQQREIQSLTARAAGSNLELTLTMAEVSNPWLPPNGFDNVLITVFFDLPGIDGQQALPHIQANMPDERTWNLAHFATGWFSFIYSDSGASAERQGEKLGVAPRVTTDRDTGTITFLYEGERIGVNDWRGASVYITTWESTGEGVYIDVAPEPSEWFFGGASADSPKIMDDVFIALGTD